MFSDEENGYTIDETKYKLKLDAPESDSQPAPDLGGAPEPAPDFGADDSSNAPDPFEKEPFDAGVDADEAEDPKKYIQQLAGKIGQSLRDYEKNLDKPDFELEKFVINSVISATNTSEMDKGDQQDIINKIEKSGSDEKDNYEEEPQNDAEVDGESEDGSEEIEEMSLGDDIEEVFVEWSKPMELKEPMVVSEGLKYHLDNGISLGASVFRYGSEKYINLLKEVKSLHRSGLLSLNENDAFIVSNAIPTMTIVDGKELLLNTIYEEEESEDVIHEDEMVEHLPSFTQIAALGAPILAIIIRNILKGNEKGAEEILDKELDKKDDKSVQEALMGIKSIIKEAEYKGKKVELNKPKRGGSKKFYVYVRDPKSGNIKKVSFGAKSGGGNLAVKLKDPKARKAFSDRHNCPEKTDKTTAGYWACRLPRYSRLLNLSGGGEWW